MTYILILPDSSEGESRDTSYANSAVSVGAGLNFTRLPYMGMSICLNLATLWGYDLVEDESQQVSLAPTSKSFLRLEVGFYLKNF